MSDVLTARLRQVLVEDAVRSDWAPYTDQWYDGLAARLAEVAREAGYIHRSEHPFDFMTRPALPELGPDFREQGGASDDEAVRLLEELRLRLQQHWLAGIECDHERGADRATCACSEVDLGWHASVGAAVDSWISHALARHKEAQG